MKNSNKISEKNNKKHNNSKYKINNWKLISNVLIFKIYSIVTIVTIYTIMVIVMEIVRQIYNRWNLVLNLMNRVGNKSRLIMVLVINISKIHFWMKNIIKILILRLEINRRVENRSSSFNYVYLRGYLILQIFLLNNPNRNRNKSRKNNNIKYEIKRTHNYKNHLNPNLPPYQHQSQWQTQINLPKTTQIQT